MFVDDVGTVATRLSHSPTSLGFTPLDSRIKLRQSLFIILLCLVHLSANIHSCCGSLLTKIMTDATHWEEVALLVLKHYYVWLVIHER